MKHKFKPSVGGNRGKKSGAATGGGGRSERQASGAHALNQQHKQADTGHDVPLSEDVRSSLNPESGEVSASECGVAVGRATRTATSISTGEREGRETERERREESLEVEQRPPLEAQSSEKTTPAVRARKKRVAPTVASTRPRRPKLDGSNQDKPEQRERPTSATNATASANLASISGVPTGSVSKTRVSRAQRQRNNLAEEVRKDNVASDAPDEVIVSEVEGACVPHQSTGGDDNLLSGVVRSSLDLVCPPPRRGEGATFELTSEERRLSHESYTSRTEREEEEEEEEEAGEDGGGEGEGVSVAAPPDMDGGRGGGRGEKETALSKQTRDDGSGRGARVTRSRKRQLQSEKATGAEEEAVSQGSKKRRTGGRNSRSPAKLREAPDRSSMTMQELIYYNPSANPMSSSVEERKRKSQQQAQSSAVEPDDSQLSSSVQTPAPPGSDASSEVSSDPWGDGNECERIVPQLRIGKDGNIVLNEDSMVVAATARPLAFDDPLNPPVLEGYGHTTSASYRKTSRVTRWTGEETTVFFRALSQVGTDFTMMTLLLPKRSRKELKNKFKKEEKSNPLRISQALKKQIAVKPSRATTAEGSQHEPETTATLS